MPYTLTIGRGKENDIVLNNNTVSKEHAILLIDENGILFIKDIGSTNGTFVNDVKISAKYALQKNDKVVLGNYVFNWQEAILDLKENSEQKLPVIEEPVASNEPEKNTPIQTTKKNRKWANVLLLILFLSGLSIWAISYFGGTSLGIDKVVAKGWELRNESIEYNIDCLRKKDFWGEMIGFGADLQDAVFDDEGVQITIKDEEKVGEEVKKQLQEEYKFITDKKYFNRIDAIAKKLTGLIKDTTQYNYEWYVMETEMINAFTVGGKIFFTTGIIDFAENDDELACVLGHEIYHNELGHIKKKLKKEKVAKNWFGDLMGQISFMATEIIGASFNQESESYCDMYGIDLAVKAGYDGCAAIGFWERMSAEEGEKDGLTKILRSHPFSDERATCIHNHVENNYTKGCRR